MIHREGLREYVAGALWVLPGIAALVSLCAGLAISHVGVGEHSRLAPLAFQGTADDARSLLTVISSTVVTVIALVLGLTVVALQLSSTQFSPRLLRNFLRDRPTQVVLSVFFATFAYSTAGLYTVGVASGSRTEDYPRLAVSGAIVLLFASLAMVVYFADHLAHSIQVDAITGRVERAVLKVIEQRCGTYDAAPPTVPEWALPLVSARSGYVQTAHPHMLLALVGRHRSTLRLRPRVGEHVVAGTVLAWLWPGSPEDPPPDPRPFRQALNTAVRIGFERTLEQDVSFGIRQLVDVACKALSPAINDPYTAVQAIDRLSVIFCALAVQPLGAEVVHGGGGMVIVPGRRFDEYLTVMCGLVRRYGAREPTVLLALLRLLESCRDMIGDDLDRRAAIRDEADLILVDAEREIAQPADLSGVRAAVQALHQPI